MVGKLNLSHFLFDRLDTEPGRTARRDTAREADVKA
jgi:hypothetical protein